MFDIGWSEILVIAVVAIVVIGPKDLPAALRVFGKWTGKMKRMARDFQNQFNEAIREAELDDVRKQVTDIGKLDPLADLKKDLNKTRSDIATSLNKPAPAADADLNRLMTAKGPDEPPPVAEAAKPAEPEIAAAAAAPQIAAPALDTKS